MWQMIKRAIFLSVSVAILLFSVAGNARAQAGVTTFPGTW